MITRVQTLGKEAPLFPDNEDAFYVEPTEGRWAVADGAGGTGLYAGEWAQFLVARINEPIPTLTGLTNWLDYYWGAFFAQFKPQAAEHYLTERKFMDEGSGATLAVLHQRAEHIHWMLYGDAVALCFNPLTKLLTSGRSGLGQFEAAPHLLNWNSPPVAEGFACGTWLHEPGNAYAVLSDALGQYVLMAHDALSGHHTDLLRLAKLPTALGQRAAKHLAFWPTEPNLFYPMVWQPLREALESERGFAAFTRNLRTHNLLGMDDYTGVLID
jgi:hypothetical protein